MLVISREFHASVANLQPTHVLQRLAEPRRFSETIERSRVHFEHAVVTRMLVCNGPHCMQCANDRDTCHAQP